PFAVLHLEIPYDQVDVNVHPNKSEVRFQNKRLVYEIVRRGLIKALSMRIGTSSVSDIDGSRCQGIGEELGGSSFDVSESQRNNERVNNGKSREVKGRKEFYERRPSPFENQLMKEFNLPNAGEKGLSERSESFDYTGIQRLPLQAETMVLEREQIDLIEDYPLGYARCQVYNTYIIAEAGDRLIIVDQHAAYERLIYECLTSIK
ncbi:MAG: DNA mismatch repair protein MutL, partial [Wolbachia sp.]